MTQATQDKALPAWLEVSEEGVTVTLKYRATLNSVTVDRVTMRAPCVRDMRAATLAGGGDYEKMEMALFCSLLSAAESDLAALKVVDYKRVQAGYFRMVEEDDV